MKEVIFNNVNLFENYKLVYQSHHFPSPLVETSYVRVPYRSGDLDLTDAIVDYPIFRNVEGTITVGYMLGQGDFYEMENNIKSEYLGRKVEAKISHENHIRKGRIIDIEFEHTTAYLLITFKLNVNPFRLKEYVTQIAVNLESEQTVSLFNGDMITTAQISTDNSIRVIVGTNSYTFNAGTHVVPKPLMRGLNAWRVSPTNGQTNVVISYQEGVL